MAVSVRIRHAAVSAVVIVAGLLLWQIASTFLLDPVFLPAPTTVWASFWELIGDGTLQRDVLDSLYRVMLGWVIGSVVAIPIGLIAGASRIGRAILDPFVHFFRFVPALALVSLFVVWFGIGEESKILLIAYATGFNIIVNTASGAASIPADKLNAARCLGASRLQTFVRVTLPATAPHIFVGMRLGLAVSYLVIVAAEALAADTGLGFLIWNSRVYFRVDWAFVGIITLGLLGLVSDRLWRAFGRTALRRLLGTVANY